MFVFSIVVPSCRNPENLAELLASFTALRYPPEKFEVIVVDDGSPVPLAPAISAFQRRLNLTLLEQSNMGPSSARNRGAGIAQGRYLVFTDDDCRARPEWLQALADVLGESDTLVCGGRTVNGLPGNIYSEASQLLIDYLARHYSPITTYGAFFPSNNLAVSKSGFQQAGGFDISLRFGEDRDFCYRCASLGFSFAYASDAVISHNHPQTLPSFLRLHSCYGGGTYAFRRACVAKGLRRVRFNPPSWYVKLISAGMRKTWSPKGAALSLLLIVSQAAVLVGMLRGALARK